MDACPPMISQTANSQVVDNHFVEHSNQAYDFDIAVSFAGEDRVFVEEVVAAVKRLGFTVFYDEEEQIKFEMWGAELTEYFADVYERRARFAVVFISSSYERKAWTRLERRSILARSMNSALPYMLPVRLESIPLPGVRASVGYLDGAREGPSGVAAAISSKLGAPNSSGKRRFNGRVPRSEADAAVVLGERPFAWELLFFAWLLGEQLTSHQLTYNDHRMHFSLPASFISDDEVLTIARRENAILASTAALMNRLLSGPAQKEALGETGEPGDPVMIEHLARRMTDIYGAELAWASRLRGYSTSSDEGEALFRALAEYASQPIEAYRNFVSNLRSALEEIYAEAARGKEFNLQLSIEYTIPTDVMAQFKSALQKFASQRESALTESD